MVLQIGSPGGRGGDRPAATEGVKVEKTSVKPQDGELDDVNVLRTVFIDFENSDWESELEDFHGTDVDVPATVTTGSSSLASPSLFRDRPGTDPDRGR